MSAFGTKQTSWIIGANVRFRRNSGHHVNPAEGPLLTQSGHRGRKLLALGPCTPGLARERTNPWPTMSSVKAKIGMLLMARCAARTAASPPAPRAQTPPLVRSEDPSRRCLVRVEFRKARSGFRRGLSRGRSGRKRGLATRHWPRSITQIRSMRCCARCDFGLVTSVTPRRFPPPLTQTVEELDGYREFSEVQLFSRGLPSTSTMRSIT
jgi:hypothetical protein